MSEGDQKIKKSILQKVYGEQGKAAIFSGRIRLVFITLILVVAVVAGSGYLYIKSALNPVSPKSKQAKIIEIPQGTSVTEIANMLESKGIVKNARVFTYYVKLKKGPAFMAGAYRLSPSMDVPEIIDILTSGKVKAVVTITIPEGTQLKEIAQIIGKAINQPESEVFNRLNDKTYVSSLISKYPTVLTNEILNTNIMYPLEGYLFPATYPFYKKKPTFDEIVAVMLNKTETVLAPYQTQMKQKQLSVHQLLTMASLIEEEATGKADRNKISSVFYNRLQKGMPLQTDPTVLYAQGRHKDRVLYRDLEVPSPYNTYQNKGLPPGPISNAGKVSIEAALDPAKTDYYYFLAAANGSVIFSKTLEEHNQEKAKYISSKK